MSRDYKKQVKERNAKMAAKGRSDRMDNFQDPQISSSRLFGEFFFLFEWFWLRLVMTCRRWGGFRGFEWLVLQPSMRAMVLLVSILWLFWAFVQDFCVFLHVFHCIGS